VPRQTPEGTGSPADVRLPPYLGGPPESPQTTEPSEATAEHPTRKFLRATKITPPLSAPPVVDAAPLVAGPQGTSDAHDWWAEQHEAAQAADDPPDDGIMAEAEELGW
jgi:hypothetical protein